MRIIIRSPKTKKEFDDYYQLRWEVLRKPWNQSRGSEKDDLDEIADHVAAFDGDKVVGCGRLHFNSRREAQIRYMAVSEKYRNKKIGKRIIGELEKIAEEKGAEDIILNARDNAKEFYKKQGFGIIGEGQVLFGSIFHWRMVKNLK